ncbi:hypothetical protein [Faecalibaculum rodentium]|uniref:hypothetical protein n=1 Tax=Faecalibaculum rodentium TaxID=1702221 RepID=UPI0026236B31|nr:hypothetical protein [Faecalibaculum rodentium]
MWGKLPEKTYRQNFCTKKTSIAENVPERKLSRGKLFAQNFHGENFYPEKLPPEFPVAHKNYPGQRWGIRPGKERPWMVVYFWIMTILKILEIHHLTQLYKGKARNDCGLYSGQGKLLQGKLIFRKT